jgi:hypothetical protein
VGLDGEEL